VSEKFDWTIRFDTLVRGRRTKRLLSLKCIGQGIANEAMVTMARLTCLKPFVFVFVVGLCIWSILLNFHDIRQCGSVTQLTDALYSQSATGVEPKEPLISQNTQYFDKTVYAAQDLIDKAISNVPNRTRHNFQLSKWTTRTDGGLMDRDRLKLAEIYGAVESVFEYGLGESTYIANEVGVRRYAGIDSDAAWVIQVRDKSPDHYRFYFADVGVTVAWGYPKDNIILPKSIFQYQLMPLLAEPQAFDVYMVDGRWRVPCMIVSFLHASARGADPQSTTVLLHDCFIKEQWKGGIPFPKQMLRPSYRSADHLLDLVDHSQNRLCVYKRKPNTTDAHLLEYWEQNYRSIE
jgi:hypothetical protein